MSWHFPYTQTCQLSFYILFSTLKLKFSSKIFRPCSLIAHLTLVLFSALIEANQSSSVLLLLNEKIGGSLDKNHSQELQLLDFILSKISLSEVEWWGILCMERGGIKLWTIKTEWQEGARRNVQNIDVIYEHVANRCGRVIETPIIFIQLDHICISLASHPSQIYNMLY